MNPQREFPRVWVIEGPTDGYGVGVAFANEAEARQEAECWGGNEVFGPFYPAEPGVWLVKDDEAKYVAEAVPGCVYFTGRQCEAKRFYDQGKAYRLALKWDLAKVVRLVPRSTSPLSTPEPK